MCICTYRFIYMLVCVRLCLCCVFFLGLNSSSPGLRLSKYQVARSARSQAGYCFLGASRPQPCFILAEQTVEFQSKMRLFGTNLNL